MENKETQNITSEDFGLPENESIKKLSKEKAIQFLMGRYPNLSFEVAKAIVDAQVRCLDEERDEQQNNSSRL